MSLEEAIDRNTAAQTALAKNVTDLQADIAALREQLNGGAAAKAPTAAEAKAGKAGKAAKDATPSPEDAKLLADAVNLAVDYVKTEGTKLAIKEAGQADAFAKVKPENHAALLARLADDIRKPITDAARALMTVDKIKEIVTEANGGVAATMGDIAPGPRIAVYQALHAAIQAQATPPADENDDI